MTGPESALLITWVEGGPESRMPWLSALRALAAEADALPAVESPINLLVGFHVPGSAYKPKFEGTSIGRYTKSDRGLVISVALPAVEPPNPRDYLCRQLAQAVLAAEQWASRREKNPVILGALRELVMSMCDESGRQSLFGGMDQDALQDEDEDEGLIQLVVKLTGGEGVSLLDKRHQVEDLIDQLLTATSNGYCDGGDIGAESANIFAYVYDPASAVEGIVSVLGRESLLEGALIAVDEGEGLRVTWPDGVGAMFEDV